MKYVTCALLLIALFGNEGGAAVISIVGDPMIVEGSMADYSIYIDTQLSTVPVVAAAYTSGATGDVTIGDFTPGPLFEEIIGADPPYDVNGQTLDTNGELGNLLLGTLKITAGNPGSVVLMLDPGTNGGIQYGGTEIPPPDTVVPFTLRVVSVPEPSTFALVSMTPVIFMRFGRRFLAV